MSKIREIWRDIYRKQRNFILYVAIGTISSVAEILVYYLLYRLVGMHYQWANVIGYVCGCLLSFILNRSYNFKVRDNVVLRLMTFALIQGIGYLMSMGSLYYMVEILELNEFVAKAISVPLVALLLFFFNKFVTFRRWKDKNRGVSQ